MNRHLSDKIPAPTSGRLLLLALLLCICGGVSADPQAVQHLPNLTIRNFAQDKVGYIWIATDNGLCRYNGQTYYYYQSEPDNPASLPANRVHDIRTDDEGTLWIATADGICIYNPLYDNFERLLTERGLHPQRSADRLFGTCGHGALRRCQPHDTGPEGFALPPSPGAGS